MTDLSKYIDSLTGGAAKAVRELRKLKSDEDMEVEARGALAAFSEHAITVMERAEECPEDEDAVAYAGAAVAVQRGEAMALGVHFITSDGVEHRCPFVAPSSTPTAELYDGMMKIMEGERDGKGGQPYLIALVQIVAALTVVIKDGEDEEEATLRARKANTEGDRILSSSVVMIDGRIGTLLADTSGPGVELEWMHTGEGGKTCKVMHPSEELMLRYLASRVEAGVYGDQSMEGWTTEGWCDPTHNTKPDGDDPVTDMES